MRDRRPRKPHRYAVYDEQGRLQGHIRLELDDAAEDAGTPLCKATLLSDQTAVSIGGLPADPTPDDALRRLATLAQPAWHPLDAKKIDRNVTWLDVTLGGGYKRYLLEMDIASTGKKDTTLKIAFKANGHFEITKAGAAHAELGRDTRLYWDMIPGTYPHFELVDADPKYSPSFGFAGRSERIRVDWEPYMEFVRITVDGAMLAAGSSVRAWGWK